MDFFLPMAYYFDIMGGRERRGEFCGYPEFPLSGAFL